MNTYFTLFIISILSLFSIHSAFAAPPCCKVLSESALQVRDPEHVTLIAVTRAGERLVAVGIHGVIIYSDNNGKTWTQAKVPVNVTLTSVSFPTAMQGWAVGHFGVVLHTVDGGKTWQRQLDGKQVNTLALTAAQAAAADGSTAPAAEYALRRANHFLDAGPMEPFLTIWAPRKEEAIVLGAYRMADKTTDGGKTWVDWSLHINDKFSFDLYDVNQVGDQVCIVAEMGLIFCSTDNGQNFDQLTPTGPATLLGILPTGDGGMLTFGIAGSAYISADKGKTWETIKLDTGANITAGITLSSGEIVLVDEAGDIFLSKNHGKSFSSLQQQESMSLYGLAEAANGNLILVGSGGVMVVPKKLFN